MWEWAFFWKLMTHTKTRLTLNIFEPPGILVVCSSSSKHLRDRSGLSVSKSATLVPHIHSGPTCTRVKRRAKFSETILYPGGLHFTLASLWFDFCNKKFTLIHLPRDNHRGSSWFLGWATLGQCTCQKRLIVFLFCVSFVSVRIALLLCTQICTSMSWFFAYPIFVTGTTGGACVNIFCPM